MARIYLESRHIGYPDRCARQHTLGDIYFRSDRLRANSSRDDASSPSRTMLLNPGRPTRFYFSGGSWDGRGPICHFSFPHGPSSTSWCHFANTQRVCVLRKVRVTLLEQLTVQHESSSIGTVKAPVSPRNSPAMPWYNFRLSIVYSTCAIRPLKYATFSD